MKNTPSLAFTVASSSVSITDPSVVIQAIKLSDHDYYRLGREVNLAPLMHEVGDVKQQLERFEHIEFESIGLPDLCSD